MGKLDIIKTDFKDLYIIETKPFEDKRGSFARLFCQEELKQNNIDFEIKQINHSFTKTKGSIRGLHFQYPPYSESKIIKCIKGEILDIAVDIRYNSPTFLKYFSIKLSENNNKMILIPKGFAHGFQTLEDDCEIVYFVDEYYNLEFENGLRYNDEKLNIKWELEVSDISQKDMNHKLIDNDFIGVCVE